MARRFYTCIIVPDASHRLHKLRIPVQAVYVLSAIGIVSFFVAVALGFTYIGMASKVADYSLIKEENARLKINTKQLQLSTDKLTVKISALEDQTQKITRIFETDALFRRLEKRTLTSAGGSRENLSTADLLSAGAPTSVESIRSRMEDLENQLSLLDKRTEIIKRAPTTWPVQGRIGSHYGRRLDPFTGAADMHLGIDIVAPFGSVIKAPADGVVLYSQRKSDYGNLVIIEHAEGLTTRYGHLLRFNVRTGQTVNRGDVIGYIGMTGRTTAPHLHYEVRLNDRAEDPRKYLR